MSLLRGLLVVPIAAVAAFNVSMNTQESELSLLALANVEALANGEGTAVNTCYMYGYNGSYEFFFNVILTLLEIRYTHVEELVVLMELKILLVSVQTRKNN